MIEKYINGSVRENRKWLEERMLNLNLVDSIPENEAQH
jgi:hypothetical protein